MVFFTCGACGTSIKKPQVEKHIFQCRNFGSLSCMDCNKDFHGDEYKAHTKCITELEKYSEVGFKQPASHNKGEKKQESWVEIVRATLNEKGTTLNPSSRSLLHSLSKHDNCPRKRPKFLNFVNNISKNAFDHATIQNVFNLLEKQFQLSKPQPLAKADQIINGKTKETGEKVLPDSSAQPIECKDEESIEVNGLNKREKKAERRKKQNKEEKKNKKNTVEIAENAEDTNTAPNDATEDKSEKKKKKKRKRGEETDALEDSQPENKRKVIDCDEAGQDLSENGENENCVVASSKVKFNWGDIITGILQKQPDNQISLKKLRKKSFAEYYAVVGDSKGNKSTDDLTSILNKQIKKGRDFTIVKDKVILNLLNQ